MPHLEDGLARAVLFDLDGTLIDSLGDIAAAMNHSLVLHGLAPHPLAAYKQFIGEGVINLVRKALPAQAKPLEESVLAEYRKYYAEHALDQTQPYAGVRELLERLNALEIPIAILSNKPDAATQELVTHFFGRAFQRVRGERLGTPRKPDPSGALAIASELGIAPADWLFVGDSAVDMQTAARAGMTPVGVRWGFRSPDELLAAGAELLVTSPEELLEEVAPR